MKECDICRTQIDDDKFLCYDCFKTAKKKKEIRQCKDCGEWYYSNKKHTCIDKQNTDKATVPNNSSELEELNKKVNEIENTELTCITCGKPSNGKHFCLECYHKYKNKTVIIQIEKCKDSSVITDYYENNYTCKDGHVVKSQAERSIDDYLYDAQINHAYEYTLPIDNNPKHDLHPDFYIPEINGTKNIYIEHWGYNETNIEYTKTKEYKMPIYEKLCKEEGITLIYTTLQDITDINGAMNRKLKYFEKGKINH